MAQDDLAQETGLEVQPVSPTDFALEHDVRDHAEVDAVMATAGATDAQAVTRSQETFYGGHAGCLQDLDGHLWVVAWNPARLPD